MDFFRVTPPLLCTLWVLALSVVLVAANKNDSPFPTWSFQRPNYKMDWNKEPPIHIRLQDTLQNTGDYDCLVIGIMDDNDDDNDDDDSSSCTSKSHNNFGVIFEQLDGKYKGILSKLLFTDKNNNNESEEDGTKNKSNPSSKQANARKKKKRDESWQELSKVSRISMEGEMNSQRLVICRIKGDPSKDAGKVGRALGSKIAAKMKGEGGKWAFLLPPPPVDTLVDSNRTDSVLAGDFLSEMTTALWSDLYQDKRFKGTPASAVVEKDAPEKIELPVSLDFIWDHPIVAEPFELPAREAPEAFLARGRKSISNGENLAAGVVLAKDIVNAPHNVLNSLSLADTARRLAAESPRLTCQILNTADCEQHGMGAYLAVARGSETPPQFIHLIYKSPRSKRGAKVRKLGIVGKGLLFDTGGYNIKRGMMELMKFDCGGAAAVFGAARAIAKLAPEGVEVHFVVAACENMINDRAMVPGDILIASNGKTIEVINTDAEGRLTMADALVYVDKVVGCDEIIELSTLTGACMVALGNRVAGLWSKNDALVEALSAAAKVTGEKVWHMPLEDEYKEGLKSKFADLNNMGGKYAGAISAALFLHEFVSKKTPYAHIDMAGPVWSAKSGATGWGAKLVTEWVCAVASAKKKPKQGNNEVKVAKTQTQSKQENAEAKAAKTKKRSSFAAFKEWLVTD